MNDSVSLMAQGSDSRKRWRNFGRMSLALSLVAALGLSVEAKSLKPVKDVRTENEVINLYNQALKYAKEKRNVHARVVLEKAAIYDPTSVSAHIHAALSEIYHGLGNPNRAISEALLALRYDRSMKTIYYNLGLYCKDANRYDEAVQYLSKFAESASGERKQSALSLIESLRQEQVKMGSFTNNDPDYLGQLMAENSAHQWAPSSVPLKVFIDRRSNARGFRAEFPDIARDAFITWYHASGKKLSFGFVDNISDADINVEWTDGPLKAGDEKYERMKAGLTTSTRRDDTIIKARIQIRTMRAFSKEAEPSDRIKETCLHEIGHALGLNGHSTNTADIMYFGNTARQLPALTKRDKATMARLYDAYPRYPMVGVDTSFPYPPPTTDIPRLSGAGAAGDSEVDGTDPGLENADHKGSLSASAAAPADDVHLDMPEIEQGGKAGAPLGVHYPTPDEHSAFGNAAGSGSTSLSTQQTAGAFGSHHVSDAPSPASSGTTSAAHPAGWQPPPGVAWPTGTAQQSPGWLPTSSVQPGTPAPGNWAPASPQYTPPPAAPYNQPGFAQATPAYQSSSSQQSPGFQQPYAQPGQAWQSAPAPYYPANTAPAAQLAPPAVPYRQPTGTTSAGPEQAPASSNAQSNPLLQFAQQFFPQSNANSASGQPVNNQPNSLMQFAQQFLGQNNQQGTTTGTPAATPGQMVDHVIQMFQPQQQPPASR